MAKKVFHNRYTIAIEGVPLVVDLTEQERALFGPRTELLTKGPRRVSEQDKEWRRYTQHLKAKALYFADVRKRKHGLKKGLEGLLAVTVGKSEAAQLDVLIQRLKAWVGPLNLQTPDFER